MKRNNDFKIREYHVMDKSINRFGWIEWKKVKTCTSLSEAIRYARWYKSFDPTGDYHVLGEFDYEEI